MLEITDDSVLKLSSDLCLTKLEADKDLYWLLNSTTGDMFKLNETSYFILSCFDGVKSVREIENLIINRYDEDKDIILKDFLNVLDFCSNKKFFE